MQGMHDKEFYERFATYKPIAIRSYKDDIDQTRYTWGGEDDEKYKNETVWLPALGNDFTMIKLGTGFLYKREQALKEAQLIAEQLAKSFK